LVYADLSQTFQGIATFCFLGYARHYDSDALLSLTLFRLCVSFAYALWTLAKDNNMSDRK
jgi:multidrug transporter EmrE-like cation transporter